MNHPNFDAVKFVTMVQFAYYECQRSLNPSQVPNIKDLVLNFVEEVEDRVDTVVRDR